MSRPTAHCRRRRPVAWTRSGRRLVAAACGVLVLGLGLATGWGSLPLPVVALLACLVSALLLAGTVAAEAAGEPAVVRVRAAVDRLDALAAGGASLAEVAGQLQELERAVASLRGAAGLPTGPVPSQRSPAATEWTTTGVLP